MQAERPANRDVSRRMKMRRGSEPWEGRGSGGRGVRLRTHTGRPPRRQTSYSGVQLDEIIFTVSTFSFGAALAELGIDVAVEVDPPSFSTVPLISTL
jgi:hypothetical protein